MTTANISSYAFNSSNDIFYTAAGSRTNAQNLNSIRDEINNFTKVAKQSLDNSSPNPVSPSVVLDMSGTAKTLLKN
jgi:hypothetical protein